MKKILCIATLFIVLKSEGQVINDPNNYRKTLKEFEAMLSDSIKPSFKRAVFITENAYLNDQLNFTEFEEYIKHLASISKTISKLGTLQYDESDKEVVRRYWSVFVLMTDTLKILNQGGELETWLPYSYDFDDFWGERDWSKMFVTKLIATKKGNCHSMPFLYKIVCEELGVKAHLAMAPNHIYIKHWTKKTGWFNTELTSGYFPIDAWVMASGYIHLSAVQNRVYMDTLSIKNSIAVCLTDYAKGFERKFGDVDLDFILRCTDLALKHYPLYTNALILKAETLKKKFEQKMALSGAKYPTDALSNSEAKKLFDEMEKLYFHIHQIGYRMMPKEMYVSWLAELNKEKGKYLNKEISKNFNSIPNDK
jgi:hypothetical protein